MLGKRDVHLGFSLPTGKAAGPGMSSRWRAMLAWERGDVVKEKQQHSQEVLKARGTWSQYMPVAEQDEKGR